MRGVSGKNQTQEVPSWLCEVMYDGRKFTRGLESILATFLSAASNFKADDTNNIFL
jgi:hypothetical protein